MNDNIYIMMGTVSNYLTDSLTVSEYDRWFAEYMGWTDLLRDTQLDEWANKYSKNDK
jgi:hypothetical protein